MVQPLHHIINGNRWVADHLATEPKVEEVQRTWKERLFSLPWRPLKKVKYITTTVASRRVVRLHDTYFAHPDLIEEIVAATKKEEQ